MQQPRLLLIDIDSFARASSTHSRLHDTLEDGFELMADAMGVNTVAAAATGTGVDVVEDLHAYMEAWQALGTPMVGVTGGKVKLDAFSQIKIINVASGDKALGSAAFMHVAEMQNILPKEVLVFTGAATGVVGGKEAGMMVVAAGTGMTPEQVELADYIVQTFGPQTIQQVFQGWRWPINL